jgi:hypothetical protein
MHGETPTSHARRGLAAGQSRCLFVGAVVEGYACSDCAIRVFAAPLLVSRVGCTRDESSWTHYTVILS